MMKKAVNKMISVGTDLVEIERIRKSMENTSFLKRFYGSLEYDELEKRGFPPQSVAGAFAGKEAFSKALGTGIRGFSLSEVQILHNKEGKPFLSLSGKAGELARGLSFDISISHSEELATATVIAYERK